MSRIQATALLLLCAMIWGAGFVAQKLAFVPDASLDGPRLGPLGFTGLRFLLGCLVVLPLAVVEARRAAQPIAAADWRGFAFCALALLGGATFQQIGIIGTSVTNSGFLTALYVPVVPLLTWLLFARPAHWLIWPAAAMAMAGTFLLNGGRLDGFSAGDGWVVLGAVFWAAQVTVLGVHAASSGRPLTLALVQFAGCGGLAVILAWGLGEPLSWAAVTAGGGALLYAGLLSVGVAFTLQAVGQRHTHPAAAAVVMSTEAVFAALAAALLLGERPDALALAGAALILLSLLCVELAPLWRPLSRR